MNKREIERGEREREREKICDTAFAAGFASR